MSWGRPATQFGCGCSLAVGVRTILIFNLLRNLFVIYVALMTMVFRFDNFYFSSAVGGSSLQVFFAGWALAGLPLICLALWAVSRRCEGPLRMYGGYLALSFLIDMVFVARDILPAGVCSHQPTRTSELHKGVTLEVSPEGAAFACGAARGLTAATILTIVLIEAYLIYIVFSYCEYLDAGGESEISDLTGPLVSTPSPKQWATKGDYGSAGTAATDLGPSVQLFDGRYAKMV